MRELDFSYHMKLDFDVPIEKHRFTIKCIPISNERQKISHVKVNIYPKKFHGMDVDSFGNCCIYGYSEEKHDHFSIDMSGKAVVGMTDREAAGDQYHVGMYKYQTQITAPGPCIEEFAEQIPVTEDMTNFDKACLYMERLYETFEYTPGVTGVATTAEEAMQLKKGVCQDYAHILLSLCRINRIPARYVVGLLIGEGASHAWVEIFQDDFWIALDPTNNLVVDDAHIKISAGRDHKDCTINQGLFTGMAKQTQDVRVVVKET